MKKIKQKNIDSSMKKSFRLPSSILKRLEEWKTVYNQFPLRNSLSDSDIIRMALVRFLNSKDPTVDLAIKDPPKASDDDRDLILNDLMEFLPIYKSLKEIKDPNSIIQMGGAQAARILHYLMFFGDNNNVKFKAAKEFLDRTLGKPIDRQMNLNADLNSLSEVEVNNELARLIRELGPEVLSELVLAAGSKEKITGDEDE